MVHAHVIEDASQRGKTAIFADRSDAGHVLARLVDGSVDPDTLVLAIPAGGVPVALALAGDLGLAADVLVVSKITLPWNSEAGYGAVAVDGTTRLNEPLIERLGLSEPEVAEGTERARQKVARREQRLRRGQPLPELARRPVLLVDDGLASGFTLRTAIAAVRGRGPGWLGVAVPTGHGTAVDEVAGEVDRLFCVNVRSGLYFAVADAYRSWSDETDAGIERRLVEWNAGIRSGKSGAE